MSSLDKIILHLDMNSYFASVEQQANPHLRGRPVGVREHLGGIIIAPSVEAKRPGIKLGTTVWEAKKIYPQIALLPVDPDKYRHVTAKFLRILSDYSDAIEKYSIDEAFVDLSGACSDYDDALLLGLEIQGRLRQEIGEWLSASIGIGPNKLLAKIAADLGEGDIQRIYVIRPEAVPMLYDRLHLTDIPGIGPQLKRALHKLGIFSLRQLRDYPLGNLLNQFGMWGYVLHKLSRFEGTAGLVPAKAEEIKSIGHSYTLPKAISDKGEIKKLMFKLSEKIGRRMRRKNARGNVIHYFQSDKRHEGFSKQRKLMEFIDDGRSIYKAVWRIFIESHSNHSLKMMGISMSGLMFNKPAEPLLEIYKKSWWLLRAMDLINDKYGEFTIRYGLLTRTPDEWAKDTIGFGRMKEF